MDGIVICELMSCAERLIKDSVTNGRAEKSHAYSFFPSRKRIIPATPRQTSQHLTKCTDTGNNDPRYFFL